MYHKTKNKLIEIFTIIKNELWTADLSEFKFFKRTTLLLCRFFYFIFIDFAQKKTLMMSSALSYATVLGIIPITLVVIALSKGFLEQSLTKYTPKIIDFTISKLIPVLHELPNHGDGAKLYKTLQDYITFELIPTLTNINLQEIGIYGALVLIIISFSLMRVIEKAFNDIWGVPFKRSFLKLVLNYWLVIALFPAIMLVILWITGLSMFHDVVRLRTSTWISTFLSDQAGTFIALWILFSIVYKIIPNTRVKTFPAVMGGIVGGTLWQINNMLSFVFVSNAIREHYLYGSLGIIPIFLISLFIGWLIVLFGAHISYAIQNLEFFRIKLLSRDIQPSDRQEIAVICITIIALHFIKGKTPPTREDLSSISGLPSAFFLGTLNLLKNANYIFRTSDNPAMYVLSCAPEKIHLKDIMDHAIGHQNDKKLPLVSDKTLWHESITICTHYRNSFTETANPTLLEIADKLKDNFDIEE